MHSTVQEAASQAQSRRQQDMQAGNSANSGLHEVPWKCPMAALSFTPDKPASRDKHRKVSTLVDCSSGVEHWQGCLHAALEPRHYVPDRRSVAERSTWCQAALSDL